MAIAPKYGFLGESGEKCFWVAAGIGMFFCPVVGGFLSACSVTTTGVTWAAHRWKTAKDDAESKRIRLLVALTCFTVFFISLGRSLKCDRFEACRLNENSTDCSFYNITEKTCLAVAGIFGLPMVVLGIEVIQKNGEE